MMPPGKAEKSKDRPQPPQRRDYAEFVAITSRWSDNDIYGHINNAISYFYFDTAVNELLISHDVLDIHGGETIGLVVETRCSYHKPMAFPDRIHAGVRVEHIGNSAVRYGVALFTNEDDSASANGVFTHVYVDRENRRPVPLPTDLRGVLEKLQIRGDA
ncbi:acyl-CoA thioesterase [Alterisphingorhabdus coralli]|uniref:Thioesterase family protein n=1 Tax=Alterisphingorhabdus coralli TaxID=3071408 RepID=A0AA97FB42_9SPHN|nr:thioesterase family protein [Parasphingorhabdus sp. SCSIO 66989]WOE76377.1 thioesterase family protein [Parasphingorhabdus sp. SCSIO 66989]